MSWKRELTHRGEQCSANNVYSGNKWVCRFKSAFPSLRTMLESTTRRVLVVGGGVTGSMLARHLIQASKWEVSPSMEKKRKSFA